MDCLPDFRPDSTTRGDGDGGHITTQRSGPKIPGNTTADPLVPLQNPHSFRLCMDLSFSWVAVAPTFIRAATCCLWFLYQLGVHLPAALLGGLD